MIIVFILVIASFFYGVTAALEESQPYEYALETINQDKEITNALGTPIVKDGMILGSYKNTNGNKTADIKIPVSGPKGSGTLFVKATGKDDYWTYNEIRVEIKDDEFIDLLREESEDF